MATAGRPSNSDANFFASLQDHSHDDSQPSEAETKPAPVQRASGPALSRWGLQDHALAGRCCRGRAVWRRRGRAIRPPCLPVRQCRRPGPLPCRRAGPHPRLETGRRPPLPPPSNTFSAGQDDHDRIAMDALAAPVVRRALSERLAQLETATVAYAQLSTTFSTWPMKRASRPRP